MTSGEKLLKSKDVMLINIDGQLWYMGRDIAALCGLRSPIAALCGLRSPKHAIRTHVPVSERKILNQLLQGNTSISLNTMNAWFLT